MIAFLFILVGDIEALIEFASFLIWVFYGAAVVCLLVLRRTQPDIPRPYKVPLIVPIITLAVSVFLSVTPIVTEPPAKYLAALGFIASGIVVYIPFVYFKYRPNLMGKFCDITILFCTSNLVLHFRQSVILLASSIRIRATRKQGFINLKLI